MTLNIKAHNTLFIILIALMSISKIEGQIIDSKISGTLELDSIWNPKVYLSHIADFSKMYTMSESMIIGDSEVDSLGYFEFDLSFLPKENNLYRVHIAKKNASEISLIIGGKSENHFFLVANNSSAIKIQSNSNIFSDVRFLSDSKNKIIEKIDAVVRYIDSASYNATRVKSEFIANAFNEQLRLIADSCSYPLVAMYALKRSNFETNITDNTEYYQDLIEKWNSDNSIYFKNFKSKIPQKNNKISTNLLVTLGLIMSFLFGFVFHKVISKNKPKNLNIIKSLSIQERKVFDLLKEGKSNKDIAEELNIGISTAKSHVSNILSKLKLKSRKEILDLKL